MDFRDNYEMILKWKWNWMGKKIIICFQKEHLSILMERVWLHQKRWDGRHHWSLILRIIWIRMGSLRRWAWMCLVTGRKCPAMQLARKEIFFAVAMMVHHYKFCGPKGEGDV